LDEAIPERIRTLRKLRSSLGLSFEIFVDGGIRPKTVPILAAAGADGIVPGSLVFKAPDPIAVVEWIHSLPQSLSGKDSRLGGSIADRESASNQPVTPPATDLRGSLSRCAARAAMA
jgi:ribulose-phosphate 3-epimerase